MFECDQTLPDEGLELEVKLFLLHRLDLEGGPNKASTYKTRFVHRLCNEHPAMLGCPKSTRRKRVKWLVDRWKRDKDFESTRKTLMIASSSHLLQPSSSTASPVPPPEIKRAAATNFPSIKKEVPSTATMSTKKDDSMIGSPVRMLRGSGKKKGKTCLWSFLCFFCCKLVTTFFFLLSSPC